MKQHFSHFIHRCYAGICACLLLSGLFGCQSAVEEATSERTVRTADQLSVRYARGFDITYTENCKLLHLFRNTDTTRYLLLPRGMARPAILPEAQVIRTPIRRLIALSTTHVALADFVEADSILVGLDNTDYVYHPAVRQRIAAGEIMAVGQGGSINQEMVVALQPDLLMVSGMPDTELQKYRSVIESGVPVLINTEWMEETPLAKAEWVKLMAALTDREALAAAKFDTVVAEYEAIAALTDELTERPRVISGSPFRGAWYVPGGNSYRARLYGQAGARWPWQDTAAVSLPVAFENMYAYGLEADYWLNPGQVRSLEELAAMDRRFRDFKSFQSGKVFNNNRRLTPDGLGNDFFESGVVNPHLILADLTHILHPELLPDHHLFYYQRLP